MNNRGFKLILAVKIYLAILDSFTKKSGLYWRGLILSGLSFSILFGTLWYAVFPLYSYNNEDIFLNISDSIPWIVGSLVFMGIGCYMTLEGKKLKR